MDKLSKAKDWINAIIDQKAGGNSFQRLNIQMKLMLKGIPVKKILENDFNGDIKQLEVEINNAAIELNVKLPQTIAQ